MLGTECHGEISQLVQFMDIAYEKKNSAFLSEWRNELEAKDEDDLDMFFNIGLLLSALSINYPPQPNPPQAKLCGEISEAGGITNKLEILKKHLSIHKKLIERYLPQTEEEKEYKSNKISKNGLFRQWLYQQCTELGAFQVSNQPRTQSSRSKFITLDWLLTHYCGPKVFGKQIGPPNTQSLRKTHNKLNLHLQRMIIVNGDMDPWSKISIGRPDNAPINQQGFYKLANKSASFIIKGGSHTQDLNPSMSTDSDALRTARSGAKALVNSWFDNKNRISSSERSPSVSSNVTYFSTPHSIYLLFLLLFSSFLF